MNQEQQPKVTDQSPDQTSESPELIQTEQKPKEIEPPAEEKLAEELAAKERARQRAKAAIGLLVVLAVIGLLVWIFWDPIKAYTLDLYEMITDRDTFRARIESYGVWAPLMFMLFQIFQVLISPIPGELVGAAGGYTFGWLPALIYSTIGLTIGSWMNFFISRLLGKSFVERMVPPEYLTKIGQMMERQGVIAAFIMFTIPGFPKDYFCYCLGLTPMSWRIFLVVSSAGRIPGTLLLSIQGALVFHEQYWSFFLLVGLSILFIAPVFIWREKIYKLLYRLEGGRGHLNNGGDE
jgi:uncharacterized membrane protein YdjX (TVP38/TMEM64 family)